MGKNGITFLFSDLLVWRGHTDWGGGHGPVYESPAWQRWQLWQGQCGASPSLARVRSQNICPYKTVERALGFTLFVTHFQGNQDQGTE